MADTLEPTILLRPRSGAVRRAGRPRDPRLDALVLEATRALLMEEGYHRLSIEAVARRAGVHRPTIYRRWRSKADLVHDAIHPAGEVTLRIGATGRLATDLRRSVGHLIRMLSRPEVLAALPALVADAGDTSRPRRPFPPQEAALRDDFERMLRRAMARGAAPSRLRPDVLFDALVGTILFRIATRGPARLRTLEHDLTALLHAACRTTPRGARKGTRRKR